MLTLLPILLLQPQLTQTAPPAAPPPPPRWEGPPPTVAPGLCRAVGETMQNMAPIGRDLTDNGSDLRAAIDKALVESGGKPMKPATVEDKAAQKRDEKLAAALVERYRKSEADFRDTMMAMRMPTDIQRTFAASCLEERK